MRGGGKNSRKGERETTKREIEREREKRVATLGRRELPADVASGRAPNGERAKGGGLWVFSFL